MSKRVNFSLSKFFSKLKFSEKILFSLLSAGAVAEDLADEFYEAFGTRPMLRRLYFGDDPYFKKRKKFLSNILSQFIKDKLVKFEATGKIRAFKLSRKGLDLLFSKFPKLRCACKQWDGYWRVVVYDIAESKRQFRSRLRKELKKLGFKFIQKSVWISPFPLEEELQSYLKREKLWGRILVFKTQLSSDESQRLTSHYWRGKKILNTGQSVDNVVYSSLSDSFLPKGL